MYLPNSIISAMFCMTCKTINQSQNCTHALPPSIQYSDKGLIVRYGSINLIIGTTSNHHAFFNCCTSLVIQFVCSFGNRKKIVFGMFQKMLKNTQSIMQSLDEQIYIHSVSYVVQLNLCWQQSSTVNCLCLIGFVPTYDIQTNNNTEEYHFRSENFPILQL